MAPGEAMPQAQATASSGRDWQVVVVLAVAAVIQVLLFLYDLLSGFAPFLRGDRSYHRFEALKEFAAAPWGDALAVMTASPVTPGEYVFVYPAYAVFGIGGIVAFQIALQLIALACVVDLANRLFRWHYAPLVCGLAYALLPHNIVFPHQLVTEAVASPLIVFFIYAYFRLARVPNIADAVLSGLFLGAAVLIRPALVSIVPVILVVHLLAARHLWPRALRWCGLTALIAVVPFAIWTAAFTGHTGKFGFTSGVANLQWNLRSKVFLVHTKNSLPLPAELAGYQSYGDLYRDSNGIGVGRFVQIAGEHPVAFIKGVTLDALIVSGRADISKILVDYFSIGDREAFKDWRQRWSDEGVPGLIAWLQESWAAALAIVLELAGSVIMLCAGGAAILFSVYAVICIRSTADVLGPLGYGVVIVNVAVLWSALASAQIVDQAQGRLRHPAEASIILLLGFAVVCLSHYRSRSKAAPPGRTA
jgi:Dolichyl-phosphate-mannose-protein mannosyltransferase